VAQVDKIKEVDMLNNLNQFWSGDELVLHVLIVNLLIGFILSIVVMYHYRKFSSVLSSKSTISRVLPFIILTTILIISIVKSSLALSLGLVGALSIVRFRTPIKEPEELAYLFISIAIGLGLGANQTINTIAASLLILLMLGFMKKKMDVSNDTKDYYLSLDMENVESDLPGIVEIVARHSNKADMRRYQVSDDFSNVVFFVDIKDITSLDAITQELKQKYEGISISFIDQSKMPAI
jgi:uncharacterized membrane protein YhiD involved in acid resistance